MTKKFAVFILLPFEKEPLCVYESGAIVSFEKGHLLDPDQYVVCLNLDDYLHCQVNQNYVPNNLFDVNVAVRVLTGFAASKFTKNNTPWGGFSCLGKHLGANPIFPLFKAIEKGKFGNYSDWILSLPTGWEITLIDALKNEYNRLIAELSREGLLDFFLHVEMPLKCMFARVGIGGISIDDDKLLSKYRELDNEYFKAVKKLELDYGYIVEGRFKKLSFSNIEKYVKGYHAGDFSDKYFWESVELMKESSEFLNCLLTEHNNRWDMSELLRIGSSLSETCTLEYDIFGTVSGRILLSRPGIQYLKKTARNIFSPKPDHKFIYADYCQFEPGILASFSGDANLIDLYNSGDVYTGLATQIGDTCTRKIAKELFLSFVYGMKGC